MTKTELAAQKFADLRQFIPEGSFEKVIPYFVKYPVFLKITKDRKTVLGDYRHPMRGKKLHRISVNGSLNKYSFLITLLHEIAHLVTYVNYKNKVSPHGKEWQYYYKHIIVYFLKEEIFPKRLERIIRLSLENIKASTCSDPLLYRALKAYDPKDSHIKYVEDIPPRAYFKTMDGRKFQMIEKVRTRYRCKEVKSGNLYFFNALVEVFDVFEPMKR